MLITNLNLTNYRSYANLELNLGPGINIFVGKNGEGKTNIAESILYLTFLNSHRASGNTPLVKLGQTSAYIRAKVKYKMLSAIFVLPSPFLPTNMFIPGLRFNSRFA